MITKQEEDKIVRAVLKEWHMHPVTCSITENNYGYNQRYFDVHMILKLTSDEWTRELYEDDIGKFFSISAEVFIDSDNEYYVGDTGRTSDNFTKEEWKERGKTW